MHDFQLGNEQAIKELNCKLRKTKDEKERKEMLRAFSR